MATAAEVQTSYKAIVRADLTAATAQGLADSINNSSTTLAAYQASLIKQNATTTGAGVAIASFITGVTPTSAKLDQLKIAADAQVASYTALGVADPALGAFEAFGRGFATDPSTTAAFTAKYGALSTTDFVTTVYGQVYGTSPSAGAAANLNAQIAYFTNLFTVNNVPNASIAAKGAVLGQIVGYAFTSASSANSLLDDQVSAFLTNAANGSTTGYGAPLPIVIGGSTPPGGTGATLTLTAAADAVNASATNPDLKTTAGDDTIRGLSVGHLGSADVINGDAGIDSLIAVAGDGLTVAPSLTSVEKVFIRGIDSSFGSGSTLDLAGATGTQSAWSNATPGADSTLKVINLTTDVTIGSKAVGGALKANVTASFLNVSGPNDSAKIALDHGGSTAFSMINVSDIENFAVTVFSNSKAQINSGNAARTITIASDSAATSSNLTLSHASSALTSIDASALKGALTYANAAAANNLTVNAGAGDDSITLTGVASSQKFTVEGGLGNDIITTGHGEDTINGGDGNDVVTGSFGADVVALGAGNDIMKIATLADSLISKPGAPGTPGFDMVSDFKTAGSDVIQFVAATGVSGIVSGAGQTNGQNAVSTLGAGATAEQAVNAYYSGSGIAASQAGSFVFQGNTYVVGNNATATFDAAADLVVRLTGFVSLTFADFSFGA